MAKTTVLRDSSGVRVELDSWFTWWQVDLDADGKLTTGTRVSLDHEAGEYVEVPITPKQLRKIAKALKALADEVDPPAPKYDYYRVHNTGSRLSFTEAFYRRFNDGQFEVFDDENGWARSWAAEDLEGLREFWYDWTVSKVSRKDLPAAAKAA